MKKIILLAPTGQVGFELNRQLQPLGQIITIGRADLDFTNQSAVYDYISVLSPDVIVNAAAYTAVDKAESDCENAFAINRDLPQTLAKLSKAHDAWLVHYSTDYVYPGDGETPWEENSVNAPVNLYGQSKLEGDIAIANIAQKYLIFRTSWVYAARGNNFLLSMLKLGKDRDHLNIVNDQIGAPTPARLIAGVSVLCLQQVLNMHNANNTSINNSMTHNEYSGIYHLAAKGYTSWYGFADKIFSEVRANNIELALNVDGLGGIATEAYPTPAKRPKNSRLNLTKIEKTFSIVMPSWQSQVVLTLVETLEA